MADQPITVEGVDYSPEGIRSVRQSVIELRDGMLSHWPDSIPTTVMLTHVIAILSHSAEHAEKARNHPEV